MLECIQGGCNEGHHQPLHGEARPGVHELDYPCKAEFPALTVAATALPPTLDWIILVAENKLSSFRNLQNNVCGILARLKTSFIWFYPSPEDGLKPNTIQNINVIDHKSKGRNLLAIRK